MTLLSALQSATVRLVGQKPTTFFSATDGIEVELTTLANDVVKDIIGGHDWRALTTLGTLIGYDGVAFDLPSDFDRLPRAVRVWSTSWPGMFYSPAKTLNEWYDLQQFSTSGAPGWWILLGGQMQIWPTVPTGTNVQFYYQSKNAVLSEAGAAKEEFTSDTDTFRLNERVLTLGVIWRWRAWKGLEYAEDMRNYELALSQEIASDKGSQIIAEGAPRIPAGVSVAYPGVLGQ